MKATSLHLDHDIISREGPLVFYFKDIWWLCQFDRVQQSRFRKNTPKSVDLIVEAETQVLFIEIKDPSKAERKQVLTKQNRDSLRDYLSSGLLSEVGAKLFDTFDNLHPIPSGGKPSTTNPLSKSWLFILFVGDEKLRETTGGFLDAIQIELSKHIRANSLSKYGFEIVSECLVLDSKSWNRCLDHAVERI
ncbi:hypothetical protein EHM69_12135 [candidate division KSB1 bacterium]|nr:MAG: hypothetical protein EHM69_12135 [candidate division KSB1 bacterium]